MARASGLAATLATSCCMKPAYTGWKRASAAFTSASYSPREVQPSTPAKLPSPGHSAR